MDQICPQKDFFGRKRKKWTASVNSPCSNYTSYNTFQLKVIILFLFKSEKCGDPHWILHIRIRLATKFHLKVIILIFWTRFAQRRYFMSKTKKGQHYHWILHIWISLGVNFHLKLTILTICTKFTPKGHFHSKTKKVNSITKFCILELN